MFTRRLAVLGAALAAVCILPAHAAGGKTVADVVKGDAQLTTLARAVEAAGLGGTLAGGDPLTLLAPSDAAFAALPAGTLENLLKPENREQLAALLRHHLLAGKLGRDDIKKRREITAADGKALAVALERGNLVVGGAKVAARERGAENGRVHVIDKVLLPRAEADLRVPHRARGSGRPASSAASSRGAPGTHSSCRAMCSSWRTCWATCQAVRSSTSCKARSP
ncbi:MAG: fasciclin domain-containing protein [Steroidobacteraceae bacterium]